MAPPSPGGLCTTDPLLAPGRHQRGGPLCICQGRVTRGPPKVVHICSGGLGCFEVVWTHLTLCPIPKPRERGPCRTKKGQEGGVQRAFPPKRSQTLWGGCNRLKTVCGSIVPSVHLQTLAHGPFGHPKSHTECSAQRAQAALYMGQRRSICALGTSVCKVQSAGGGGRRVPGAEHPPCSV